MRDNDLFIFLRAALLEMLPARGLANVEVRQKYQPRQQGRPVRSSVFMHKVSDRLHGSRIVRERSDPAAGAMLRIEEQALESTIQFNALAVERDPADDSELTAADILKAAASIFQSAAFIERGRGAGVLPLKIFEVRNTPVENERDRFEFEPSFDAVFAHTDTFITPIRHLGSARHGIHGI